MRSNTLLQSLLNLCKYNRFIAPLLFAGMTLPATATDYSAGASMSVNASHNDNLRLQPTDKTSVYKYQATPVFSIKAETETSTIELNSTFEFNRYDKSQFNSNDQTIALAFAHQYENSSIGLDAMLIRNSTITSELLTSGVVGDKAERTEQYQITPNWSYTINENNLIQLSGAYTTQDYHTASYIGYKNAGGNISWIHILNERTKLVATATYSDYQSDDSTFRVPGSGIAYFTDDPTDPGIQLPPPFDSRLRILRGGYFGEQSYSTRTKDKGIQLGVDYQWSEQSLLQARVGRSKSDTTYPVKDPDNICTDPVYLKLVSQGALIGGVCDNLPGQNDQLSTAEVDWNWRNEKQKFGLNTTKSTQPTSNGYTVDALRIGSNWSYDLTEQDQISADVSLVRNRALSSKSSIQNTSIANRDYQSATLGYRRRVNEHWFLSASYQFNQQKYTDLDYKANGKVITLGIRYQPQDWHWSR